jgi:hypothetical protein
MGNGSSTNQNSTTDLTTGNNSYMPPSTTSTTFQAPQNPFNSSANLINSSVSNPEALNNPNSILNANKLFLMYANFNEYQSIFDISSYFQNIYNITINAENNTIVNQHLQNAEASKKNPILNIPKVAFTGNANVDDVYVTLSKSDVDEAMHIFNVCKTLKDKLSKEFASDSQNGQIGDQITSSHSKMHHYMDVIILTLTYYYFTTIQSLIKNKIDSILSQNSEETKKIRRAAMIFSSMWDTPSQTIFNNLSEFIQILFDLIFKEERVINDPLGIDYLKSLGNGNVYNSEFYYSIRTVIIKVLDKSTGNYCQDILKNIKATEGPDVAAYFNKLITDIYIKCSYPFIQYQIISSMMKEYMNKGDFVNTRLGLIAKIYLVLYIISVLSLVIQNFATDGRYSGVNQNDLTSVVSSLNDIMNKLNKYIENMNKIDMNSPNATSDAEIAKILSNLHEMSNNVQNDSKDIMYIQQNIETARLAIRNIMYNLSIIEKKRKNKIIEFWISFSILIILLISCITLLFLKKESIVLYITGITVLLVLLYKLIMLIISIIKKN